jgi:polysaccharide biosynthesis protein PslJ
LLTTGRLYSWRGPIWPQDSLGDAPEAQGDEQLANKGRASAVLLDEPRADDGTLPRKNYAVTLLTCYLILLMAIPSSLVVGPLGAAGPPADVLAFFLLCWYLLARFHPAVPLDTGRQPVRLAMILFACSAVATYISANRTTLPVEELNGADRGMIMLSGWLGIALLAADGIDHADRLAILLRRIVAGVTALAVLGCVEFVTGQDFAQYIVIPGLSVHQQVTDLMSINGLPRAIATTGQPLELAAVLLIALPLALHQARFAPPVLRLRRWAQVAAIAAALPTTVSRSAILGLLVIGLVLLPSWMKRDRGRVYGLALGAVILGWLADPSVLSSFGGLLGDVGTGTDQSITSRTSAYSSAVPYVSQHPWLGSGFQTFFPQTYFFIDNQYLTSLIETGVVGLLALVGLFLTGWLAARSARRAVGDDRTRDLLQCLAASVAAAAVVFSAFDVLSFVIAPGLTFLVLGCVGAAWRLARSQPAEGWAEPVGGQHPSSR